MQELWNVLVKYAGIPALVCLFAAAYFLVDAYRVRRVGRSALFDAERQVTNERVARSGIAGLGLLGLTMLFFGLALVGMGSPSAAEPPTRAPTPSATPRAGTTPSRPATPTPVTTSSLPTVAPPPAATNTPRPATVTPGGGGKTAVVTGTTEAGGLSLRRTPSVSGELIDKLPDGTVVELLGETRSEGGFEWQKVRDSKGREGWVAGQYLIVNP